MAIFTTPSVVIWFPTRREFLREILYKNTAIIATKHGKVDTFGDFSHTVE